MGLGPQKMTISQEFLRSSVLSHFTSYKQGTAARISLTKKGIFHHGCSYPVVILMWLVPGNLLRIPNLKPTSIERLINGSTKPFLKPRDMPVAEVPIFINFLRGMLEIDPGSRKSASELLQHEWLNR